MSQFAGPVVSRDTGLTKLGVSTCLAGRFRMNRLIKIFLFGIILGAVGAGALTWSVPVVDLHRERSLVSVQPNGGNVEEFHINLPRDRILVGLPNVENSIPAGLEWPGVDYLGDMQAETFKIRDRNNTVIGIGNRLASSTEATGPFIEWSLHFPARGSMYMRMEVTPSADGIRNGTMVSGTRDFGELVGTVREQFDAATDPSADVQGRIILQTALVGPEVDEL